MSDINPVPNTTDETDIPVATVELVDASDIPQTATKAQVALIITILGGALSVATQLIPDGTLGIVLAIIFGAITAAGASLGVYQASNSFKR